MRICYFGIYDHLYARNRILIDGLRQNDVEVIECQSRAHGFVKYFDLVKKHQKIKDSYDVIVVGFPGYQAMILAWFLTKKPIIFDCFTSLYDSMVSDRREVGPRSIRAFYFWFLDGLSMWLADKVLFDTQAHIVYASATFGIKKEKFRRIWIGAQTDIFCPRGEQKKENKFSLLFFGTFIPLQGIEYIIGATKRLENEPIRFTIIGNGQMKKKIVYLSGKLNVKNITFIDAVPQKELPHRIAEADICLGIFGNTAKTQRVIPNKVYECLAMKKPVITADTPATRELLRDEDVFFVKAADSTSLALGILRLKNDSNAMESIAQNGYDTFIKNATPKILGRELKRIAEEIL
ncbi:MAG: glycosyltransferase [Parcubacteria group bacterium]|nr:glycosyltransferase [Parcubacteria group bacterium]MBI2049234.1 glycosyltransferase [Parcubacteria group bacterium]